jgi:putative SOS response-associated peptidase YedK
MGMINARAETLAEKSSCKRLLNNRRCLVLADAFSDGVKKARVKCQCCSKAQEWRAVRVRWLMDAWKKPDGQILRSYTIVTTEPNEMLTPVHNCMPVMLNDSNALDGVKGDEVEHALSLLKPFPADLMDGYEVSKLVTVR